MVLTRERKNLEREEGRADGGPSASGITTARREPMLREPTVGTDGALVRRAPGGGLNGPGIDGRTFPGSVADPAFRVFSGWFGGSLTALLD